MGQYHGDPLITQNLFEKLSAEKYPNPPKNAKKVITEPLLLQSHQLFSNLVLLVPEKAPPSSCLSVTHTECDQIGQFSTMLGVF